MQAVSRYFCKKTTGDTIGVPSLLTRPPEDGAPRFRRRKKAVLPGGPVGTAVNAGIASDYAFTVFAMMPQMRSMSSAFRYGCIGSAKMSAAQASAAGMSPFL